MSNKITPYFMGGLGNQLFQAAHALAQGWKNDRQVVFLPDSFTPGQGRNAANYVDNVFRNLTFVDKFTDYTVVDEETFHYKGVQPTENNTVFQGYYQSTKNWFGYEDRIRDLFQPDIGTLEYFYEKYPQLMEPNTLSLHVRRSEYLIYPEIHPTITMEYILEALKAVGEYSTVFVFSDDPQWVKDNLNFPSVVYVNESTDYNELWLMGLCANHIISNSTFSWWATFLNQSKTKKIIAPSVWFGPKGPNGKDIYETYWKTIPVEYATGGKLYPIIKNTNND